MKKKILIFGITGQDGAYLANIYLNKGFNVHGTSRLKKNWGKNLECLNIKNKVKVFKLPSDSIKIRKLLNRNYSNIFFLGGQTKVSSSFQKLEYDTYDSQILIIKEILEFIRLQKQKKTKFLFGCSSEIFGYQKKKKLSETSDKFPQSPYGLSKLIGYEIIKSYREMFKIPVFSLIYFNHESNLREDTFVLKKVKNFLINLNSKKNSINKLYLGNIDILRDWGYSKEYMEITYKIMSSKYFEDFVIATGKTIKLRKLIYLFFKKHNLNYKSFISIDKKLYRRFDIKENYSNINKLKKIFNTKPKYKSNKIIEIFYE